MGCFFACFRIKADQRPSLSSVETDPCKSRSRPLARNQLASLLLSEEDDYPCDVDTDEDSADRELKHEAKFLKACGALLVTPTEIRRSDKRNFQAREVDKELDASYEETRCDEQLDHISDSPAFVLDERLPESTCSYRTSQSAATDAANSGITESQYAVGQDGSGSCVNEAKDGSRQESNSDSVAKHVSHFLSGRQIYLVPNDSPHPTPLKLIDGMETPHTLYPANAENNRFVNITRIRTQYAFPLQNSLISPSQVKEKNENLPLQGQQHEASQEQATHPLSASPGISELDNAYLGHTNLNDETSSKDAVGTEVGVKLILDRLDGRYSAIADNGGSRSEDKTPLVSSLSQWLKPRDANEKEAYNIITWKESSPSSKSHESDIPIIGMVAAHWNDEETTRVSPKFWDGNGIPNSTNKYREDQRVSWHATPFEERLEKALSDEKLLPQRKVLDGKPIEFDEDDEVRDTAAS